MSQSGWSETRVTTLSQLRHDGLSASQVAKQLGEVIRNSVIGNAIKPSRGGSLQPFGPASNLAQNAAEMGIRHIR